MRVLVVEDEEKILQGMISYLQQHHFVVDGAKSGALALEYASITPYDVVLLDINLPDTIGFELCARIKKVAITTVPIIMVTARDEVLDRVRGLNAGADDYLIKPFHFEELLARIHAIIRRSHGKDIADFSFGDLTIIPGQYKVLCKGEAVDFSVKEYEIFYYLALAMPEPRTMEQILEHIWDDEANPFSNVGRVHIMNIRKKLASRGSNVTVKNIKTKGYFVCVQ